ncbi:MAG: hypothetical protein ACKOB4_04665 [Acidobacteriota bacterium]
MANLLPAKLMVDKWLNTMAIGLVSLMRQLVNVDLQLFFALDCLLLLPAATKVLLMKIAHLIKELVDHLK